MPIGSEHIEEGLFLRERRELILRRDDGGGWRLCLGDPPEALLGSRVRVHGLRSGFDLLDVLRIGRGD
jgi:hypothetical protein